MHTALSGIAVAALVAAATCNTPIDRAIEERSPICREFKRQYDTGDGTVRCVNPSEFVQLGSVLTSTNSPFDRNIFSECTGLVRSIGRDGCQSAVGAIDVCEQRSSLLAENEQATNVQRETFSDSFGSVLTGWARTAASREQIEDCRRLVCTLNRSVVSMRLVGFVGARSLVPNTIGIRVVPLAPLVREFCLATSTDAGARANSGLCGSGVRALQCPPMFRCQADQCVSDVRTAWDIPRWPVLPQSVWSFGYRNTENGFPAIVYYDSRTADSDRYWMRSREIGLNPNVRYWPGPVPGANGEAPNSVAFHPGPTGQWSIIRFVPPQTGRYELQSFVRSPAATTVVRVDWFPLSTPQSPRSLSVAVTPDVQQRPVWTVETARNSAVDIAVGSPNDGYDSDTTSIDLVARFVHAL